MKCASLVPSTDLPNNFDVPAYSIYLSNCAVFVNFASALGHFNSAGLWKSFYFLVNSPKLEKKRCTLSILCESKTALHANHAKFLQTRLNFQFELAEWKSVEQDPVSTMHKTGWTNYSSFLVWYGNRFLPMALITWTDSITIFMSVEVDEVIFELWQTNKRPANQVNQEQASLLLTSEKAVFCNFINDIVT